MKRNEEKRESLKQATTLEDFLLLHHLSEQDADLMRKKTSIEKKKGWKRHRCISYMATNIFDVRKRANPYLRKTAIPIRLVGAN